MAPQPPRTAIILPKWLFTPGLLVFVASLAAYVLTLRVLGIVGTDMTIYLMGGEAYPIIGLALLGGAAWLMWRYPSTSPANPPPSASARTLLLASAEGAESTR